MSALRILETCLYAEDLTAIRPFYENFLGLEVIDDQPGRHLFFRCQNSMLLVFNPRHTEAEQSDVNGQIIPLHGSHGDEHLCFAVSQTEIQNWRDRLNDARVEIESEVNWPNGAVSLYFRDPAGNSLEFATPALWGLS